MISNKKNRKSQFEYKVYLHLTSFENVINFTVLRLLLEAS